MYSWKKKRKKKWPPENPPVNQTEPSDWVRQWAPFWGVWVWIDECTGSSAVELYGGRAGYVTEKASLILSFLIMRFNFWKEYSARRISLINHCLPGPTTAWMTMNDLMLSCIIILTPLSSRPIKCIRFLCAQKSLTGLGVTHFRILEILNRRFKCPA